MVALSLRAGVVPLGAIDVLMLPKWWTPLGVLLGPVPALDIVFDEVLPLLPLLRPGMLSVPSIGSGEDFRSQSREVIDS